MIHLYWRRVRSTGQCQSRKSNKTPAFFTDSRSEPNLQRTSGISEDQTLGRNAASPAVWAATASKLQLSICRPKPRVATNVNPAVRKALIAAEQASALRLAQSTSTCADRFSSYFARVGISEKGIFMDAARCTTRNL